jgi:hypothetical protein
MDPSTDTIHRSGSDDIGTAAYTLVRKLEVLLLAKSSGNAVDNAHDAAVDAVLAYLARPALYDPAREVPLEAFLFLIAKRRLQNRSRADHRRRRREWAWARERDRMGTCPAEAMADAPPRIELNRLGAALQLDAAQRAAASSWLAGERRTAQIAEILGLTALSCEERRAVVKRFKDRIAAWIRRHGRRASFPRSTPAGEMRER